MKIETLDATIRRLIAAYRPHPSQPGLREIATKSNSLPVYSDVVGDLFITPDGDVLIADGNDRQLSVELRHEWRMLAFVYASRRYPELASLLPLRPVGTLACELCAGRGFVTEHEVLCGKCSGLGWLGAT